MNFIWSKKPVPSFSPNRRWKLGLDLAISLLAVAAILAMVNFLASRHYRRFQWAANFRPPLSPVTGEVLRSITNQVKVIVFFDRTKPLYDFVADVLDQYRLQCPKLDIEFIDYVRSPGRAKMIQIEYGLASAEEGDRILFDAGGKRKVVYARELSEYDYAALLKGKEAKRTGFKGEELFTSALYSLIDPSPVKVYFLTGHNEHDYADTDDQFGYLKFAKVLLESQVQVARLEMTALLSNEAPDDCQLLVIANPLRPLAADELEKIEKYLNQGGRLLVLFSSYSVNVVTGLERLLAGWGVAVGRNFVYDSPHVKAGNEPLIVTHFGQHPIVSPLAKSRILLIAPRSVGVWTKGPQAADAPKVTELATTGPDGVASLGGGRIERQGASIPLMVAVEKGAIQGITANRGSTRIVVVGESYFLANTAIEVEANRDFARNAANWLLSRDILVQGIGTRPIKEYRITMTPAELNTVRWLLVGVFPGGALMLGFLVWLRRRA